MATIAIHKSNTIYGIIYEILGINIKCHFYSTFDKKITTIFKKQPSKKDSDKNSDKL
jgi:hypothetical protein